jgi:hypothetical protein
MIKCTECGYENLDGLDYCDSCGAKLNAATAEAGASEAAAPPAPEQGPTAMEAAPAEAPAAPVTAAPEAAAPAAETPAAAEAEQPTGELHAPAPAAAEAGAPVVKAMLKIVRGGRQGHEFPLEPGNNLIGRWDPETGAFPEVDLEADDPEAKISRKHALIRIDGGKITLEDIGSLNGTFVNRGSRLGPGTPVELKNGDEIIVGKTFFKVLIEPVS